MSSASRLLYPIRTIQQTHLHLSIMRGLRDRRAYFGLITDFCGITHWHG